MAKSKPLSPRVRVHRRRHSSRRFHGVDYELSVFMNATKQLGTEISIAMLRDMADCEELWELIGLAGRLEDERDEVLQQIEKIRTKIAAPYKKKAAKHAH